MTTEAKTAYILLGVFVLCLIVLTFLPKENYTAETATEPAAEVNWDKLVPLPAETPTTPRDASGRSYKGIELCNQVRARARAAIRDGDGPGFLEREVLRSCRDSGE